MVFALLEHRKFASLGFTRDELLTLMGQESGATFSKFVSKIFDLYGEVRAKALVRKQDAGPEGWMLGASFGRKLAFGIISPGQC